MWYNNLLKVEAYANPSITYVDSRVQLCSLGLGIDSIDIEKLNWENR